MKGTFAVKGSVLRSLYALASEGLLMWNNKGRCQHRCLSLLRSSTGRGPDTLTHLQLPSLPLRVSAQSPWAFWQWEHRCRTRRTPRKQTRSWLATKATREHCTFMPLSALLGAQWLVGLDSRCYIKALLWCIVAVYSHYDLYLLSLWLCNHTQQSIVFESTGKCSDKLCFQLCL